MENWHDNGWEVFRIMLQNPVFLPLKTIGFTPRNTINTILKFEHEKKRILEMSFRGQQGITRCHFMFFTIVLRRPTIWQVYERTTNSIDPLTISSFTFFERILPEVVFVVYSSFVPISEKKICFWSGATWVPNGHWQVLNGGIPEAVICSNKPTGGQRQSSYSSPLL